MARGSKRGGRPTEGEGGRTEQVRIYEDLYAMVYWIQEATGEKAAALIDPLLRPQVGKIYDKKKDIIEQLIESRGGDRYPWRKRRAKKKA